MIRLTIFGLKLKFIMA